MELSRPKPFVRPVYDDETERRARAAALTAAGEPFGRFMTVQLDLALRGPEPSPETYELACEEVWLLVHDEARWRAEAGLEGDDELTWFRGAPEELSLTWPRFLDAGRALLRQLAPRRLTLTGLDGNDIAALARCPELAAIEHLRLRTLSADEAQALADSPYLGRLRALRFGVDGEGIRALAASGAFERLEELSCDSALFTGADFAVLAHAPWFQQLRVLRVESSNDGAGIVQALVDAPSSPRLRTLDLGYNGLGSGPVAQLAAWPGLASIEELDLAANELVDGDVGVLLASPHLGQLSSLSLSSNRLGEGAIRAIAAWPRLPRLCSLGLSGEGGASDRSETVLLSALSATRSFGDFRRLFLHGNLSAEGLDALQAWAPLAGFDTLELWGDAATPFGDDDSAALAALARSPHLSSLRSLELVFVQLDAPDAMATLLACPSLGRLERLVIFQSGVLDEVTAAIAAWPAATTLETLVIENGEIGSAGAEAIAASASLRNLRCLSLAQNEIDAPGARAIAASPSLRRLEVLDFNGNPIGDEGGAAIVQAFAKPPVRFLDLHRCKLSTAARDAIVDALPADGPHLSVDSDEGTAYGESFPKSPRGAGTVSFGSRGYLAYMERFARRRG